MILSNKLDIKNLTFEELADFLKRLGEPSYRAIQVFRWLYTKGVCDFNEITELSGFLREKLSNRFYIYTANIIERYSSNKDGTARYILGLEDKNVIECVLIKQGFRNTICVSTQIGCRFNCSFCASALKGFIRNLKCSEILEQFLAVKKDLGLERINNVVFMGMGEPLDNTENLIKAIRVLNSKYGMIIGMRKITVSSCGLVDGIKRLIESRITPELSISLHAPDDKIRNILMPVNKRFRIEDLIKIAKEYTQKTKRLITFEYVLIKNINDSPLHARKLVKLLKSLKCKINLIVYNSVKTLHYQSPHPSAVKSFYDILKSNGISVTIRSSRGEDIDAACGQLRLRYLNGIV
jgi:23S rRNA (adenine2503-C2)-methyltransferase